MFKNSVRPLIGFYLVTTLCGCFMGSRSGISEPQTPAPEQKQSQPTQQGQRTEERVLTESVERQLQGLANQSEVGSSFQLHLMRTAYLDGAKEAWGLFTEAGYVNAGQHMVYRFANDRAKREWTKPNSRKIEGPESVTTKRLTQFEKSIQHAQQLKPYTVASFDGLRYEYIHIKINDKGQTNIVKRLFLNNPPFKEDSDYQTLIRAFTKWNQSS